ncbi:prolipoprotein diacylglyceryl transferase [Scatolibacter rhodanostii]|uniref:prolipoprotein diacylglyceryl transferase n=1 Tax=Scatolibacter rhodanostii TaxID=2014781 RepID=UPI000C06E648|nr:prolipoprotein diacylglyceryl transferase [Scatolibacter rhodanostii]
MQHLVEFPKLGIEMTVNETVFTIGNFEIKWYGLLIGIGFFLAILYAMKMAKKMNVNDDKLLDVIIFGVIGGIVGARLYYVIFYPGDKYINNPMEIFQIRDGGLGFYGGFIGGLLCALIVAKIKKMNIPALFDLVALGFLIGQSFGRWGNFTNQEAFGGPTDLPWGMQSDNTRLFSETPVHPCFLYESLLCALGFVLLHFFTTKLRRYDGQTFLLYLVWYGISRFFIEMTRTDSLIVGNSALKVSMLVSALFVAAAVVLLFIFRHRTSLTGVGSKEVMQAVVVGDNEYSTIFTDEKLEDVSVDENNSVDDIQKEED